MAKLKKENLIEGWKIVLKYLKPHKRAVFVLSILSVISAALNAVIPYLAGKVIDGVIDLSPAVFTIVGVWFLVRVLDNFVDWRIEIKNIQLGAQLEAEYLINGYSKLLLFPLSFHKNYKLGETTNRISRAAVWLENLARIIVIGLSPQFLSIVFALIFMIYIQPLLAGVIFAGVVLYTVILVTVAPRLAELGKRMHKFFNIAYGEAYDAILNVSSVKQATAERYEARKLHRNFFSHAFGTYVDFRKLFGVLDIWQRMLIAAVQLFIYLISITLIIKSKMTVGQLVMFNGYAAMFFGPFVVLGQNWQTVQSGIVAMQNAEKIINRPEEEYSPKNSIVLEKLNGEVKFVDANFHYSKKQGNILRNINLHVSAGEKVALVGESGVGKSTLVDLISYYYKPASGKILIDGHNVKNLDLKFLRSQIAVVPQEIMLFNDTIKNNIKYGSFDAADEEVAKAAELAHADEFINSFPKKYEQLVGERGIKLSMGQKQRVALARAFLRNPKILILDEPTSALDAKSEKFIQESLKELMKGRTTFIIAHRLSTVREVDKIFVLDQGTIAESGTHEELLAKKSGVYRRLYELQVGFS